MEKTRIGVIGLGGVAQVVHLPILAKLDNVTIASAAEVNKNRLNTVAEKFNIPMRYRDYKEMLENSELDAVVIATPTSTHTEIALDCLKAGKNILVEKPIARTYDEAKQIHNAVKKCKCMAMVGMNLRFRPDAMLLKSLLNSGELGDLFYIRCSWLRKRSSEQKWFVSKKEAGGGVIIDLGVALLDLAMWLLKFQPIKSVTVQNYSHSKGNVEDSAVGFIRLENNAVVSFEVSWSLHSEKDSFNLTAFGTKGTAHLNPLRAYRRIEGAHIDYTPAQTANQSNLFKKSYENEIKHFIGAIRGTNPLISSIDDALTRMKLLEAIYKSAEQNSEIKL